MNWSTFWTFARSALGYFTAYAVGRKWFTPSDASALTEFILTVGPVMVPAAITFYSNWNTVKVDVSTPQAVTEGVAKVQEQAAKVQS